MIHISNHGDFVVLQIAPGVNVEYDGVKMRRLTGNDQARYVAEVVEKAIALVQPKVPDSWVDDPWPKKPKTAAHIKTENEKGEYVPSGNSNEPVIEEE